MRTILLGGESAVGEFNRPPSTPTRHRNQTASKIDADPQPLIETGPVVYTVEDRLMTSMKSNFHDIYHNHFSGLEV
jgi:hypothetical protein